MGCSMVMKLRLRLKEPASISYRMRLEVTNMYVKHMKMTANSGAWETNIEQGLSLRLNQHREMRGCLKQMSCQRKGREQRGKRLKPSSLKLPACLAAVLLNSSQAKQVD